MIYLTILFHLQFSLGCEETKYNYNTRFYQNDTYVTDWDESLRTCSFWYTDVTYMKEKFQNPRFTLVLDRFVFRSSLVNSNRMKCLFSVIAS